MISTVVCRFWILAGENIRMHYSRILKDRGTDCSRFLLFKSCLRILAAYVPLSKQYYL